MKVTKHSLDHIELISSGDTAFFEIRLIVAMHDWSDDDEDSGFYQNGALSWLMNLLSLAGQGEDIKTGADSFMRDMLQISEERVHFCKVEQITLNEEAQ